ncbi:hypothetical protein GCM10022224_001150 [Nonomuraea antimicrobica]|uniref:Uncharacterized protein n=1 Tax=Nonomuraea antimicrobica TaxID=561173 RepID=A0ABP7AY10_9ACTN
MARAPLLVFRAVLGDEWPQTPPGSDAEPRRRSLSRPDAAREGTRALAPGLSLRPALPDRVTQRARPRRLAPTGSVRFGSVRFGSVRFGSASPGRPVRSAGPKRRTPTANRQT